MSWTTLIDLIVKYGLPLALKLADKWGSKDAVTEAEWAELRVLAANTPRSVLIAQLTAAGIPLTDPKAVALLAMVN